MQQTNSAKRRTMVRGLSIVLSALLVTSGLPLPGVFQPLEANAAGPSVAENVYPGGVGDGLISWVNVENSMNSSDGTLIESLTDLAPYDDGETEGDHVWTYLNPGTPNSYVEGAINFNGGISIVSGSSDKAYYYRTPFNLEDTSREVFSVQGAEAGVAMDGFPWYFGGLRTSDTIRTTQWGGSNNLIRVSLGATAAAEEFIKNDDSFELGTADILNAVRTAEDLTVSLNGVTFDDSAPSESVSFAKASNANGYYFGAGHQRRFNGLVSETILYNRELLSGEKTRVNSYLALKYGITLSHNYVASDGTTAFWNHSGNNGYNSHITGIGRDHYGAQNQKQSRSQANGANVTIALGNAIETSNAANENEITNDISFFVFGDNGNEASFAEGYKLTNDESVAIKTLERVYKVQKTDWADALITLQVDEIDMDGETAYPAYLIVSDSATFASNVSYHDVDQETGSVALNSSEFDDGNYFTFGSAYPLPDSAQLELGEIDAENHALNLIFDREITLDNLDGFTIHVGGESVALAEVTFEVDEENPTTLIIYLPEENLSQGGAVTVNYDGTGTLIDAESKLPVEQFEAEFAVVNKVPLQHKIEEATGIAPPEDYTEESWTALQNEIIAAAEALNDDGASQTDVDDALNALQSAINGLKRTPPVPVTDRVRFHDGDTSIVIEFDKDVAFELSEGDSSTDGFTVTVDGNELTNISTFVQSDEPNKVILQFPTPLSADQTVHIHYDGSGHLKGVGASGTAVEAFNLEDPFTAALTITAPDESTMDKTPTARGTVSADADTLIVTIKDSAGNPVDAEGTLTWEPGDTEWTYQIEDRLELGAYTVEATATDTEGLSRTKTKPFTIDGLKLETVAVHDATPNQATLTFNLPVKESLTAADFASFEVDGRTVTDVIAINGTEVIVEFSEPFAPGDPLTVAYDETAEGSGIVSAGEDSPELSTITSENTEAQDAIDKTNNIIPLEIVTVFVEDDKLKIIFNKPIHEEHIDLSGLTFGGIPVQEPFEISGNELSVALPEGAADNTLAYDTGAGDSNIEENRNPNNKLGDLLGGNAIDLGETEFHLNDSGQLANQIGIVNGNSEVIASENFDVEQPGRYKATVPNGVSEVGLSPEPVAPSGTVVKVHVNGAEVSDWSQLPLAVGSNLITVGVYDADHPHVLLGQYQFAITRNAPSSGGWFPAPVVNPDTEIIEVDVAIGGENPADITRIPIKRTTDADGRITDDVTFTKEKAEEAVNKANETGTDIARIIIPDEEDKVSEVNVVIPEDTVRILYENGIDLEIYTENAIIRLPNASLEGINEDFYFRLVPVRDSDEQEEIEDRAQTEEVVRIWANNDDIEVVERPMTIETNLSSRPVTLILPLKNVELPENIAKREAYLERLGIFIEHSDGEKQVVRGDVVSYNAEQNGLQFTIQKFSTFTIIYFNETGSHAAYMKGFPDGTFKPAKQLTRAEMAMILSRILEIPQSENAAAYPDVAADHWAKEAIGQISQTDLMHGYPDGTFQPERGITRAEMAAIIARLQSLSGNEQHNFHDVQGHWAEDVIARVHEAGYMQGYPDGTFRPDQSLIRAEAVAVINRVLGRGPLYGMNAPTWSDVPMDHWGFHDIEEASQDHDYRMDASDREQIGK